MDLNLIGNIAIVTGVTTVVVVGGTKLYENHLIKKSVDSAIKFADMTGKTGKDKLVRAVTYIENIVLSKVPIVIRPLVDYLINSAEIVKLIERQITKIKNKK